MPGGTAFNPAEADLRWARAASEGLLPVSGDVFRQGRIRTTGLAGTFPTIQDDSLDSSGVASQGFDSKIDVGGPVTYNVFAEDHGLLLANAQRKGSTSTLEASVAWVHKLAPTESTDDYSCLVLEQDRDNGLIDVFRDCVTSQLVLNFNARGILNVSQTFLSSRYDRWAVGTQTVGTGTTIPEVRGLLSYSQRALADSDIYLEIQSVAGLPNSITVRAKVGAAASFSGSGVTVTPATWTTIVDGSGNRLGDFASPFQVYFADFTGATATDVFRVNSARSAWAVSLPTKVPYNEITATVTFDGAEFRVQQGSLTITNPWVAQENVGGRFLDAPLLRGLRSVVWSFSRQHTDTSIIDRLETGERAEIILDAQSPLDITGTAASNKYRFRAISKNCGFSGEQVAVTSSTDYTENVNANAELSTDGTYPSDVTFELTNGTQSLAG